MQEKLTSFWTLDGQLLVSQGTGPFKDSTGLDSVPILEEGRYVDGVKDGRWRATRANGQMVYEEEFKAGKLIQGKAYDPSGQVTDYTVDQPAEFIGGQQALGQFLTSNISYPATAQKQGPVGGFLYPSS